LLLRDINLLEIISHATHERILERLVHAKGAGARGFFEVTLDISQFTSANFLSEVGKKTDLCVRFSTIAGGRGSADTVRDTRGFAFKLYTDEGNLDWVFFSEPVFPIRDGSKFPSFVHCQRVFQRTISSTLQRSGNPSMPILKHFMPFDDLQRSRHAPRISIL
jgi:catalase